MTMGMAMAMHKTRNSPVIEPLTIESMSTIINETAQYITFKLGDELFAINVAQVREV